MANFNTTAIDTQSELVLQMLTDEELLLDYVICEEPELLALDAFLSGLA